jgi:FkbM family methyltransferase
LGTDYGGWRVPLDQIQPEWTCYTAGVGEDASFDLALAHMGCDVVAIDPTPRAVAYMRPLLSRSNLRLAPYALWSEDREVEFFPPIDPTHVSFSITNRQHTHGALRVPGRTVGSIAREFGHASVELLKLDIEGAEYAVLESTDLVALGVRVLCVEFHDDQGLGGMLRAARAIIAQGFSPAAVAGTDVTFVAAAP